MNEEQDNEVKPERKVPDFSEFQAFVKAVEADLNTKFDEIGYACFIFKKDKGQDSYATLISNAPDQDRVNEIITPFVRAADAKQKVIDNQSKIITNRKLRRMK